MIIVTIQNLCEINSEKEIYINKNNNIKCYKYRHSYIESIEYIDNKYEEVIIKEVQFAKTYFYNLRREYHNPIGPAKILNDKNGKPYFKFFYINGCYKDCEMLNDYSNL